MADARARQRVVIDLADPIFASFREFAAIAYPDQSLAAALREAALVAMGTDPMEAAKTAARRAAWLFTRRELAVMFGKAMNDTATMFNQKADAAGQALAEMEAAGEIEKAA